jgi:hypothetical protein
MCIIPEEWLKWYTCLASSKALSSNSTTIK